jgi:hypothetical protein
VGLPIGLIALLVVGLGGGITANATTGALSRATAAVAKYLTAVIDGDVEEALSHVSYGQQKERAEKIGGVDINESLLSPGRYAKVEKRPTSFDIISSEKAGSTARVKATLKLDDEDYAVEYTLRRVGGLASSWDIVDGGVVMVGITTDEDYSIEINGKDTPFDDDEDTSTYWLALPGIYDVEVTDSYGDTDTEESGKYVVSGDVNNAVLSPGDDDYPDKYAFEDEDDDYSDDEYDSDDDYSDDEYDSDDDYSDDEYDSDDDCSDDEYDSDDDYSWDEDDSYDDY